MPDAEVESTFRKLRWPDTDGAPYCPECGGFDPYEMRRKSGCLRFECKACAKAFSLTSGTLFASHKKSLRIYLAAIVAFCNEVKGKSMLALSREMDLSYKTAFVLAHKIREAISVEFKGREVGGVGKIVEIDAAYFGGKVRKKNIRKKRKDRRKKENRSPRRKAVIVIRERGGKTLPAVFRSENAALGFIRERIRPGTVVHADESKNWNVLHKVLEMVRINHEVAYSLDGACTNWAEGYFSRLRRSEIGHHHKIAGPYLLRYAQESAWREDNRRTSNGNQVRHVVSQALRNPPSVDFSGYWQRRKIVA